MRVKKWMAACVGVFVAIFLNGLFAQEPPQDGQHQFDRVAKFNEVRNRSFDENLKAITTDDGGLGNILILGTMTNTVGWIDYFQPVFADPRMRRMHEHLAGMDDTSRQAALSMMVVAIRQSLEAMKTDDVAAGDFCLAHGARCLLLLLCDYDDPRLEEVIDQWLEVRDFIKLKFPGEITVDENGKRVQSYRPVASIDDVYLYNVYFQKLVRLKGRQDAERQIMEHARLLDVYEPFWFIKPLTWTTDGKTARVFAVVLGSGGAGRELTRNGILGSELLKRLREDVAKMDSE
ncbi:MAG: hypothetical protein JNL67_19015 [Planctomycetaceae bacterium]|nr:hypothetical protein [Planctomycetaceae bacterium]